MEEIKYSVELEVTPEEQEQWLRNPITKQLFEICSDNNRKHNGNFIYIALQAGANPPEENKCILHLVVKGG